MTVFHPGAVWKDTDGNRIRAHQPHIHGPMNGTYFWYGAAHVGQSDGTPGDVNLYTSRDLYNWDFQGAAYESRYVGRPSFLGLNPRTGKYVLWAKGGKSFQSAVADSPYGPFKQVGSYYPTSNSTAGDSAAFLDPVTNTAYYVYSQHTPSRAMKYITLDDDWTAPADDPPLATVPGNLEAPAPFYSSVTKRRYVWCSHTSGWKPNAADLLSAASWTAKWSAEGNPSGSKTTFGTQGSHVLPLGVVGGVHRMLYMGDRYEPYINTEEGSRYIMLPLEVRPSGDVVLLNESQWSIENWPEH